MALNETVLLVTKYGMGNGAEDLQLTLFGKLLQLLDQSGDPPPVICFYTEGVKLVTEGSPVLEQLSALEKKGTRLVVCSTCLNYYGLADKLEAGIAGGMADILEALARSEKVISL